ncbi:MAG TPA: hypothetical protein VFY05_02230, partial [Candidatus Angelobacter sp.]|nr:hypothetical protein [Candidatus Angelobacter sp.]
MFHLLYCFDIAEAGIEKVVSLPGKQLQRVSARVLAVPGFRRRYKGRDRIQSLGGQRFTVKFSLTARSGESPLRIWQEWPIPDVEP